MCRIGDQLGESTAPFEICKRQGFAVPAVPRFEERFHGAIDAKLHHVGIREELVQGAQVEAKRGVVPAVASGRQQIGVHKPI